MHFPEVYEGFLGSQGSWSTRSAGFKFIAPAGLRHLMCTASLKATAISTWRYESIGIEICIPYDAFYWVAVTLFNLLILNHIHTHVSSLRSLFSVSD